MTSAPTTTWAYRCGDVTLEEASDTLTIAGVSSDGISEDSGVTTVWFATRPDHDPPLRGKWEQVEQEDWAQSWKAGLRPVTVGRVTIVPPWLVDDVPDDAGDILLQIEPGLAFGTGHHETTTGCLRALQTIDVAGAHVVDVGTGTGVLALAASALGAARVTAVDIDDQAIEVATANISAHDLGGITLAVGSCEVVVEPGQVVIANIITDLLLPLAPALVDLLLPGGVLITSGVSVARTDDAVATFTALGLSVVAEPGREWTVLISSKPRG